MNLPKNNILQGRSFLIYFGFAFISFFLTRQSTAQNYSGMEPALLFKQYRESKPDSGKVKLLIDISTFYIHKRGEAKRNLDSALYFANAALELGKAVHYLNAKEETDYLRALVYIKSHASEKFGELLKVISVPNQIKLILEMIRYNTVILGLNRNDADSLTKMAILSLHLSQTIQSTEFIAQSYLELSNINYENHDLAKGKEFFFNALKMVRKPGYSEAEAAVFSQASGNVRVDESILEELLKTGKRLTDILPGLKGANSYIKIQQLIVMGYDQLSYYYAYKGKLEVALFYSLQMVNMLDSAGIAVLNEFPFQTIGKIYFDLGKLDQSIVYLKRAASISYQKGDITDATVLKNITKAFIGLGRPNEALVFLNDNVKRGGYEDVVSRKLIAESLGNCYFELKLYDKAEVYYLESLRYGIKNSYINKLISYVSLCKLYVVRKKYNRARTYLNELIADSNAHIVPISVQRDVQYMLFQVDSASGKFPASIGHLHLYKILNDSIFNEKRNAQFEQLNLQFETDKKNKELTLKEQNIQLLTKREELQEADLKRARFSRNIFISGIVTLFLILGMVYNRYRFKQKTNKLLQLKQEEISQSNQNLQHLNAEQQKLLTEKEWLVKEIHHRVKNNLQMIISLLNAQSEFLEHPSALNAIKESRERMQAIALIHQKLYQPDQGTLIDMRSYIGELVTYLAGCFTSAERIKFNLDVESIQLDVSQSVPVGLILNEAITNINKYAFKERERGNVIVELHRLADSNILLRISDNGKGFPSGLHISESNSLGIQLIVLFAEQLEGKLQFSGSNGVEISLVFKPQYPGNNVSAFQNNHHADRENTNS